MLQGGTSKSFITSLPFMSRSFGDLEAVTQPCFTIALSQKHGWNEDHAQSQLLQFILSFCGRLIAMHVANRLVCLRAIYFWLPTCILKIQKYYCLREMWNDQCRLLKCNINSVLVQVNIIKWNISQAFEKWYIGSCEGQTQVLWKFTPC